MPLRLGTTAPSKLMLGATEVTKAYLGTTLVYEKAAAPGGFTLPASTLMAYSVARAVDSSYVGNLIRVRRSTDNAELDIGVDGSGNLDEAALLAHTGTGTGNHGYITTLYEQTGSTSASDFAQATASLQPEIVRDGVVQKARGKPTAVQSGTGSAHRYLTVGSWTPRPSNAAVFLVGSYTAAGGRNSIAAHLNGDNTSNYTAAPQSGGTSTTIANRSGTPSFYSNGALIGTQGDGTTTRADLWTAWAEKGLVIQRVEAADFTNAKWSKINTQYIGATSVDGCYELPEMIFSDAPSAADISAIEANQAGFYGITL